MMKIIVLALCVFGTINAASIDVVSSERDDLHNIFTETYGIVPIVMKALPSELKELFEMYMEDLAEFDTVTFENELSQDETSDETNHQQIVKREANEDDLKRLIMGLHRVTSKSNASFFKLDKLRKILNKIEGGFDFLSGMVEAGMVKGAIKKVCKLIGHPIPKADPKLKTQEETEDSTKETTLDIDEKAKEEIEKDKKSNKDLADKLCNRNVFEQLKKTIKSGKSAMSFLSKTLDQKNLDRLKKMLSLFKKKKN